MTGNVRWRKSSYSGGSGGDCVEVAGGTRRVLVRDTRQAGAGPVLRFSPAAWRRFAGQVKRPLASGPRRRAGPGTVCAGERSRVLGRSLRCLGFSALAGASAAEVSAGGVLVSAGAGVGAVGESAVARDRRALGRGGRAGGGPGNPRLWGGFPGPPVALAISRCRRRGVVFACAVRIARRPGCFLRSCVPVLIAPSPVTDATDPLVFLVFFAVRSARTRDCSAVRAVC